MFLKGQTTTAELRLDATKTIAGSEAPAVFRELETPDAETKAKAKMEKSPGQDSLIFLPT